MSDNGKFLDAEGTQFNIDKVKSELKDRPKVWDGKKEDWEALPDSEKDKWDYANFNNDTNIGIVTDACEPTNPNAISSQGTYAATKDKLTVTDTMPTPTSALEGATRLYIGTGGETVKGGIYECQETDTGVFEWVLISTADVDLSLYKKIFDGTQATWDNLSLEEQIQYDIANITDDYNESEEIEDITSQLTFHTENIAGGNVYVSRYGKIVQVDVHSIKVTAYSKDIVSGLPKPVKNRGNTFPAQGDGNPQTLGLFMISADGVLASGTQTAGLAPNVVWDATFCYLTED